MNKNKFASVPPMGWNSYDYYDTCVNEEQIKANADYMALHMKDSGWEYIVVDIEWYASDAGTKRDQYQYIPFSRLCMDDYARLIPCEERFPSSKNGQGFKPLADYVHGLGLKFGIHIMRGIPRQAAYDHCKLLGTHTRANELADPSNICYWNPDMYGVRTELEAAQAYYDSLLELYALWGVDFIKCDDICRMDMASAEKEIQMLYKAIQKCKRPIVLSLSPGPARIDKAWMYEKYGNMWRITDDFWDSWPLLLNMFERCELWQNHVSEGCYPDCDMLPVGRLGKGFGDERETRLTKDEQVTMMTLWSIFRSPMMIGGELTLLDDWTLSLLTNPSVLALLYESEGAKQVERDDKHAVWMSKSSHDRSLYIAVFNFEDSEQDMYVGDEIFEAFNVEGYSFEEGVTELWENKHYKVNKDTGILLSVPSHGAKLLKLL